MTSATVYLWFPDGQNIGHASMHIGPDTQEDNTVNYVSWWPLGDMGPEGLLPTVKDSSKLCTLRKDKRSEGGAAHRTFKIEHLDVAAMVRKWLEIRTKPDSHYRLMRKNCSTIVARVLRAGGASELAKGSKQRHLHVPSWDAHRTIWTPKNVYTLCNAIVKHGYGVELIGNAGVPISHVFREMD